MTDQHPGYREDWDITSEAGSLCFASAIYSRLVGGEQDEATLQWLAKYLRANAAPQHITVMTDQHQHHATPEQWAKVKDYAPGMEVCSCLLELHDRIQQLESSQHAHIESYQPPKPANQHRAKPEQWAFTESRGVGDPVYATCSCLIELRARVEALEATQHAHIEAKAAEAGARCAVEQLRSKPGSWQPIKVETTYGSDASIPELSQSDVKAAEMEWARTAPGMRSDVTDRVLALQDQIRDGTLTLADALKEIGGKPIERTRQTTYLAEKIRVRMIQEQKNSNSWQAVAEAVLREVAKWLRSEYPQREGFGTAWASLLDNEANC